MLWPLTSGIRGLFARNIMCTPPFSGLMSRTGSEDMRTSRLRKRNISRAASSKSECCLQTPRCKKRLIVQKILHIRLREGLLRDSEPGGGNGTAFLNVEVKLNNQFIN